MGENGRGEQREWIDSALKRFEGQLIRYAQRITADPERARDVVQETFLQLCRQPRAELDGRLAEWLFRVCRNKALDVRRKESRMTTLAECDVEQAGHLKATPEQAAEEREESSRVMGLFNRLPTNQGEVLRLKFQNGLSYREISEVTGLSVSNVGFLIHRGLKRLREDLNPPAAAPASANPPNSREPSDE